MKPRHSGSLARLARALLPLALVGLGTASLFWASTKAPWDRRRRRRPVGPRLRRTADGRAGRVPRRPRPRPLRPRPERDAGARQRRDRRGRSPRLRKPLERSGHRLSRRRPIRGDPNERVTFAEGETEATVTLRVSTPTTEIHGVRVDELQARVDWMGDRVLITEILNITSLGSRVIQLPPDPTGAAIFERPSCRAGLQRRAELDRRRAEHDGRTRPILRTALPRGAARRVSMESAPRRRPRGHFEVHREKQTG